MKNHENNKKMFICFILILICFPVFSSVRDLNQDLVVSNETSLNNDGLTIKKVSQEDVEKIIKLIEEAKYKLSKEDREVVQILEQKIDKIEVMLDDIKKNQPQNNSGNSFLFSKYALYGALLLSTYGACYYYGIVPSPANIYNNFGDYRAEFLKTIGKMANTFSTAKNAGQSIARSINTIVFKNATTIKDQLVANNGTYLTHKPETGFQTTTNLNSTIASSFNNIEKLSNGITAECVESVANNPRWKNFEESYNAARYNTLLLGPLTLLQYAIIGHRYR